MDFEWDERKRQKNILKHRFDFLDAVLLFQGAYVDAPAKRVSGEARCIATGLIGTDYATVIYTLRDTRIRIIPLRSARDGERDEHQAVFG